MKFPAVFTMLLTTVLFSIDVFALRCGDTITESITLTRDLNCVNRGDGLQVGASNITIDLNGHTISGSYSIATGEGFNRATAGIYHRSFTTTGAPAYIRIIGPGKIRGFHFGIRGIGENWTIEEIEFNSNRNAVSINGGRGHKIKDNEFTSNQVSAIVVSNVTETAIRGNVILGGFKGIQLSGDSCRNNSVWENEIMRTGFGIALLSHASNNRLSRNKVSNSSNTALLLAQANNNTIEHDEYKDGNLGIVLLHETQTAFNSFKDYDTYSNSVTGSIIDNNELGVFLGGKVALGGGFRIAGNNIQESDLGQTYFNAINENVFSRNNKVAIIESNASFNQIEGNFIGGTDREDWFDDRGTYNYTLNNSEVPLNE